MRPCPTGKISYPSPQTAWRAAQILRRKRIPHTRDHRGHSTKKIVAYSCPNCPAWHVTSTLHDDPKARTT